ncbi:MAG TPA: sodium:alanine symporter family protein [Clostridia bacterium]|nr:sodium:alanine symporter family protein [Clostridia bacterium]
MQNLEKAVSDFAGILWSWPMIAALFGTHIYLTFKLRGIQLHVFKAIRLSVSKEEHGVGDVSPFSSLTTALAATIGTGNIVGVATAIVSGGPGAVFWMWISGIFGMSTKYAESLLSVKYRVKMPDGSMAGGPMYVMERGLHKKWMGMLFAFFTAIAAFGIGAMVQANSISGMMLKTCAIPPWVTGVTVAVLTSLVIIGGIKSISKVCSYLIPVMGLFYILSNLLILGLQWYSIPHTIQLIVTSAFSGQAALGGFSGAAAKEACRYGISRGLFSNESGLGSEPIVAAAARTGNPVRQALVSYTGTFWDTVILAAVTGIMIVNSGLWTQTSDGGTLTGEVFAAIPVIGPVMLSLALLTFTFATCIGWSFYAQKAVEYLLGPRAVRPYQFLYVLLIFIGSVFSIGAVWNFSDMANAFMCIPNLFSILALRNVVVKETDQYLWHPRPQSSGNRRYSARRSRP